MKFLIVFLLVFSTFASERLNKVFHFPEKGELKSDFRIQFKRWNYEYEDDAQTDGIEDILEAEKMAYTFTPTLSYVIATDWMLSLSASWQFDVIDTHLELNDESRDVERSEKEALHSPQLFVRKRVSSEEDYFFDIEFSYLVKTHSNLEPTINISQGQMISGSNIYSLKSINSFRAFDSYFKLFFQVDYHTFYRKRLAIFDEIFETRDFYGLRFGLAYLHEFNQNHDILFGLEASLFDSFQMKGLNQSITFRENIGRTIALKYSYRKYQETFGIPYFSFNQTFELHKFSYGSPEKDITSDNTFTHISIGLESVF